MSDKIKSLVNEIDAMGLADLSKLVGVLEKDLGVSSVALQVGPITPVGVTPATVGQTSFDIVCQSVPIEKKISAIKVVREILNIGLKEAKDFIDALPKTISEGVEQEQAEKMKVKLTEAGIVVGLK